MAADPALLAELRSQVRRGLQARGCPEPTAIRLAGEVVYEPPFSIRQDLQEQGPMLDWRGTGIGLDRPDDPDEAARAVEQLVQSIVDDNAEAHDRNQRGEPGYQPLWPLPHPATRPHRRCGTADARHGHGRDSESRGPPRPAPCRTRRLLRRIP